MKIYQSNWRKFLLRDIQQVTGRIIRADIHTSIEFERMIKFICCTAIFSLFFFFLSQ